MRCDPITNRYLAEEQPVVDRFTVMHLFAGAWCNAVGISAPVTGASAMAWEVGENTLKLHRPAWFPDSCYDGLPNATADVVATMVGWLVVEALR